MLKTELELNEENLKKTIEENILKRNSQLIMLAKLLATVKENLTISIDGKWGSGKSFFIKQFKYLVENIDDYTDNKIITDESKPIFRKLNRENLIVYYNAWENDMHTNPLKSLIYNILNDYPKIKDQITNFKDFSKVLKSFLRDFLYSASFEYFDINNIDKLNNFDDLAEEIKTIEEVKTAFNKLINEILGEKKRLILIIDELDRCRPTFAVEMLETIKHFYTNEKITIIVSTNNIELSNTIKNFYGNNFDSYGYLDKFYDFTINLETKDIKSYLQQRFNYCKESSIYQDTSYLIMKYLNFSLRECNKYITLYNLLENYFENESSFNKENNYVNKCILIPLALALKIRDINKYNLLTSNQGEKIIVDFLEKEVIGTDFEKWLIELFNIKGNNLNQKIIDVYHEIFNLEYSYQKIPFFEILSLLGTNIKLND